MYEVATGPIGHPPRRRWGIAAIAGVVVIGIAVVKPWGVASDVRPEALTAMSSASESGRPTPSLAATSAETPIEAAVASPETWPVTQPDGAPSGARDPRDPSTTTALAKVVGTWGIAALGNGPRFFNDEPWVDWSAVLPEATGSADRIASWPVTGICADLPVVLDSPVFVAVTTPAGIPVDPPIDGWWSDGGRTASLDGSIRELSGFGSRGISYLERIDGSTWPPGRYEFHVGGGDQVIALVVCLARAG